MEKKPTGLKVISDRLKTLNDSFLEKYKLYQQYSEPIAQELLSSMQQHFAFLENVCNAIGVVDILNALAMGSKKYSFNQPQIVEQREISLQDSYNPALLNTVAFVQPNSITLKQNLTFITGANSGGKTQTLKMLGNVLILAQIGSDVPGECSVPIYNQIMMRFGSTDDTEAGLSTFMWEMVQMSKILNNADAQSLVLVDELGRGTSLADGYGLTIASAEHFLKIGATSVFVTHLHDVCYYFSHKINKGIIAKGTIQFLKVVSEMIGTQLHLLYKLENGIDVSHGIQVAQAC